MTPSWFNEGYDDEADRCQHEAASFDFCDRHQLGFCHECEGACPDCERDRLLGEPSNWDDDDDDAL